MAPANSSNTFNNMSDHITDCAIFPDSPGQCSALVHCKRVSAALSIIGVIFTLGIIFLFKKHKEFSQRMIAHLSVAALCIAISYILGDFDSPKGLCLFQAAFLTYSLWVVQLFIIAILLNLYSSVTFLRDLHQYEKLLVAICWGVPLIFMLLPFIGDHYGQAGAWCWIKNRWEWRFGLWYIWKFLSVIFFIVVVIYLVIKLKRQTQESRSDVTAASTHNAHEDIRTLRVYPIVYFIITIFPLINRIYNSAAGNTEGKEYVFALVLLQTIFAPLLGATVAVVFVLDRRTLSMLTVQSVRLAIKNRRRTKLIQEYNPEVDMTSIEPRGVAVDAPIELANA